jgi:hypothetical protein
MRFGWRLSLAKIVSMKLMAVATGTKPERECFLKQDGTACP